MRANHFDDLAKRFAHPATRRTAVRLLTGGLLGGLLTQRGMALTRAAQRSDRDGDGLYDDDELRPIADGGYGTDPDVYDTDGDGVGDGEEVYLGTDPLVNENAPPAPPALVCGENETDCGGFCVNYVTDPSNCGYCGRVCPAGSICEFATCTAPACVANGESCYADFNCCNGRCATRGVGAKGICEAVFVPACPEGQTDCGGSCVNLNSNRDHCGGCFTGCFGPGLVTDTICENGQCVCDGVLCIFR